MFKNKVFAFFGTGVIFFSFSLGQSSSANKEIKNENPNLYADPALNLYLDSSSGIDRKIKAPISCWAYPSDGPTDDYFIFTSGTTGALTNSNAYYYDPVKDTYIKVGHVEETFYNGSSKNYAIIDIDDEYEAYRSYVPLVDSTPFVWYSFAQSSDDFIGDEKMFHIAVDDSTRLVNATYGGYRTEADGSLTYLFWYDGYISEDNSGAPVFYNDAQQNNAPIYAGIFSGIDPISHEDGHTYWKFTSSMTIFNELKYVPYTYFATN